MKQNNDVFAADSDSLVIDISCYQIMFEEFLREHIAAKGHTAPEITGPILAAYNVGSKPGIMSAMVNAFVAGVNAGMDLCINLEDQKNSN